MDTKKWTVQIDRLTQKFIQTFGSLTIEQLNTKGNLQSWSIAQNMEHLIRVNESYYPLLTSLKKGNYKMPFIGKFDFVVNQMGKTILNSVRPETRKKIKTFTIWEPSQSEVHSDILKKFEQHQEELKLKIIDAKDLLDRKTIISSPVNKYIVYKLETAFDIIAAHEERHFEQAREVLTSMIAQKTKS